MRKVKDEFSRFWGCSKARCPDPKPIGNIKDFLSEGAFVFFFFMAPLLVLMVIISIVIG